MIFWRREPKFKMIVKPEEPVEKVYCRVLKRERRDADRLCRPEEAKVPRLAGIWGVPHRESKLLQTGNWKWIGLIGGTFPLYATWLRPGRCADDRGVGIEYLCAYPHLVEYKDGTFEYSLEGKYFRLRDDVEEVGAYEDRLGHPIYIVRNRLGETFRLVGFYARIYHILGRRGGWVSGADLQDEEFKLYRRLLEKAEEVINRMSREGWMELYLEYFKALNLLIKLRHGEVEELPQPVRVPADIERMFAKIESLESFFESYFLAGIVEETKDELGGDRRKAFLHVRNWFVVLALGLLVYEALIVEMGIV